MRCKENADAKGLHVDALVKLATEVSDYVEWYFHIVAFSNRGIVAGLPVGPDSVLAE